MGLLNNYREPQQHMDNYTRSYMGLIIKHPNAPQSFKLSTILALLYLIQIFYDNQNPQLTSFCKTHDQSKEISNFHTCIYKQVNALEKIFKLETEKKSEAGSNKPELNDVGGQSTGESSSLELLYFLFWVLRCYSVGKTGEKHLTVRLVSDRECHRNVSISAFFFCFFFCFKMSRSRTLSHSGWAHASRLPMN